MKFENPSQVEHPSLLRLCRFCQLAVIQLQYQNDKTAEVEPAHELCGPDLSKNCSVDFSLCWNRPITEAKIDHVTD